MIVCIHAGWDELPTKLKGKRHFIFRKNPEKHIGETLKLTQEETLRIQQRSNFNQFIFNSVNYQINGVAGFSFTE